MRRVDFDPGLPSSKLLFCNFSFLACDRLSSSASRSVKIHPGTARLLQQKKRKLSAAADAAAVGTVLRPPSACPALCHPQKSHLLPIFFAATVRDGGGGSPCSFIYPGGSADLLAAIRVSQQSGDSEGCDFFVLWVCAWGFFLQCRVQLGPRSSRRGRAGLVPATATETLHLEVKANYNGGFVASWCF